MNIIRKACILGVEVGELRDWVKKEGLSRVKKLQAFSLSHGGVVVKAVVLKAYKERESIPTWPQTPK